MAFTHNEIQNLPDVLSAPRFATYLATANGDPDKALALYQWNLEVSAAFFIPLQICEVAVRNAIVKAIEAVYGPNWPWQPAFEISLATSRNRFSPRTELIKHRNLPTTGKIVAELKFIFWERMLTARHDGTLWNPHFRSVFPNTNPALPVRELRATGYQKLSEIRDLRNRIAHHEPIFRRNIQEEYDRICDVIAWTNVTAASWVDKIQTVTAFIASKP